MGFSFGFPVAHPFRDKAFLRPARGGEPRRKNLRPELQIIFLGDKQGACTRKKARTATGLSPGMNCLPHFTIALRR
jgi:hypothetical protein